MSTTMRRLVVVGCGLVLLGAALRVAVHDPTSEPVSGDQASFVYQALSLRGGDLSYDAEDQARWLELEWADQPHGLFVQQRGDGWAFAKPLGYAVLLAPVMAVADAQGIALVGAALVLGYAACWYGIGRLRWDAATALAVATAATVASHAWLFGFPAHADLFVAVLVGLTVLGTARVAWPHRPGAQPFWGRLRATTARDHPQNERGSATTGVEVAEHHSFWGRLRATTARDHPQNERGWGDALWLAVAAAATALLVTEKLPALIALAPLVVLATVRAPRRARLVAGGVGAVVLAVSLVPYLYYSDGESWSAYGGDRYYAVATTPWSGGTEADLTPWRTRDSLSPSFVLDRLGDPSEDLASATLTYAVGRHTGLLTFEPLAALLLAATAGSVAVAVRGRSAATNAAAGSGTAAVRGRPPGADAGARGARAGGLPGDQRGAPAATDLETGALGVESTSNRRRARGNRLWGCPGGVAAAAAVGLVAYVALYLLVFTDNYFGGGQSIGNRYFLQISPMVALIAVASPLSARLVRWCTAGAAVWALVVLHPLLRAPEEAFFHIERTSATQRLLPFDGSQEHAWRFECEPAECVPPALDAYEG